MQISELKTKAKNALSDSYWKSFAATFIFKLLYSLCNVCVYFYFLISTLGLAFNDSGAPVADIMKPAYIALIIGLTAVIFVGTPLMVGHNSFYIRAADNKVNLSSLFGGFKYRYFNIIKIMFLYGLCIALWVLLACISVIAAITYLPNIIGCILALTVSVVVIIQQQQYFMVGYIIADNPKITAKRAFKISKTATKEYKVKLFLFQLSFIGWMLLGTAALYVGTYFVMPYFYAAKTQFYLFLKEKALENGLASRFDFNIKIFTA